MLAVYRPEALGQIVDPHVPRASALFADWPAFEQTIPKAHCLVAALEAAVDPATEGLLARIGSTRSPPLILVVPPGDATLDLLARLTCFGCVSYDSVGTRLPELITKALEESPRRFAAAAIIDALQPDALARAIVREIFLAEQPVRNEADLATRLGNGLTGRNLRDGWRRARPESTDMKLEQLVRWGRLLRLLQRAEHGAGLVDLAIEFDVDESTVYRDFNELLARSFRERAGVGPREGAQVMLRELGIGPAGWRQGRTNAEATADSREDRHKRLAGQTMYVSAQVGVCRSRRRSSMQVDSSPGSWHKPHHPVQKSPANPSMATDRRMDRCCASPTWTMDSAAGDLDGAMLARSAIERSKCLLE